MAKLLVTGFENDEVEAYSYIHDIEVEGVRDFIFGLGNGLWDELRIVGETESALNVIRRILLAGGYKQTEKPKSNNRLYQHGDECWQWFVFINPQPRPQDFQ